jgi:hypothetical protein
MSQQHQHHHYCVCSPQPCLSCIRFSVRLTFSTYCFLTSCISKAMLIAPLSVSSPRRRYYTTTVENVASCTEYAPSSLMSILQRYSRNGSHVRFKAPVTPWLFIGALKVGKGRITSLLPANWRRVCHLQTAKLGSCNGASPRSLHFYHCHCCKYLLQPPSLPVMAI